VSESFPSIVVAGRYRKYGDTPEVRRLARDVIRWECRPYPTMRPAPLCYLIKFYARCTVALPMFKYAALAVGFITARRYASAAYA